MSTIMALIQPGERLLEGDSECDELGRNDDFSPGFYA